MKEPITTKELIERLENKKKDIPDIMVNTDIAFREAPSKTLAKIRELFNPVDFDKLEFEEDINDYNLSLLSKEAVAKIIEIIKEDELNRHTERVKEADKSNKINEENGWVSEHSTFKINPTVERELYRKKIESELEGKTEEEQLEYFQKTFDDTTEYLKNAKSPEELLETIYDRKAIQDVEKVGISFSEIQRIKQEKELKEKEAELLLRQVFNQCTDLDVDMQKILSEHYKKIEKRNE